MVSRYTGGERGTGIALEYVLHKLIFNTAAGARRGAKKFLIALIHGRSNTGVKPDVLAAKMHGNGVASYVIGVTKDSSVQGELTAIAGYSSRVLYESSYGGLYAVMRGIYGGEWMRV